MEETISTTTYRANGKLLLTGEYFVLDGALALAIPTRFGQTLEVSSGKYFDIIWKSIDSEQKYWFTCVFQNNPLRLEHPTDIEVAKRLWQIFQAMEQQNPDFFKNLSPVKMITQLEFPRDWGLGSSSTLLHLLAQWAGIDPFVLLEKTFGGSGYDIACAGVNQAILYQKKAGQASFTAVENFLPNALCQQLYFVHLGKKQNSREGIQRYRTKTAGSSNMGQIISDLTQAFLQSKNLVDIEKVITEHESVVAKTIELPRAKKLYFSDYWGEIKSLGAWGGDFVMTTSNRPAEETKQYFNEKGFSVVLSYEEMVLEENDKT